MTKKQKVDRIEQLKHAITGHRFIYDSYGHLSLLKDGTVYRFKFKANNLRFESKKACAGSIWFAIFSTPIVKIEVEHLDNYLKTRWLLLRN